MSGSFWLEETVWGDKPTDTTMQKTFIFKPTAAEADVPGFPKGGSAAREVMGKAVSDQLQAQMGLDFGTPETSLTYAIFNTSRAGRLEGSEISLSCINDDLPAVLEKRPGDSAYPKLRYDPATPSNAKFTCRTKDEVWNIEYRGVDISWKEEWRERKNNS